MTRETSNDVWDSGAERGHGTALLEVADRRQTAKASNDVVGEGESDGEDMFARAGVAAE